MKQSSSFWKPLNASLFLTAGIVIGGLTTVYLAGQSRNTAPNITSSEATQTKTGTAQKTALTSNSEPTYFQEHYVGFGGKYVRIPERFCQAFGNFESECAGRDMYREFDLREISLPVDHITSAVTDHNTRIVYSVDSGIRKPNGCLVPDLYLNQFEDHPSQEEIGVRKLKNDPAMWKCGAIGSYIESLSPGSRYIHIAARGQTSASGDWLYDIKLDALDKETAHSPFYVYISADQETPDDFLLYYSGCQNEELMTIQNDCTYSLTLRDNVSGKTMRLTEIENALKKKGISLENVESIRYEMYNNHLLHFSNGDIDGGMTVSNIDRYLKELRPS